MSTTPISYPNTTTLPDVSNSSTPTSKAPPNGTDSLANESTFLQLLVAQMKNQDPTQPVDSTQFVTQLAQFSELEQSLAMRTDLDALAQKYASPTDSSSTPAASDTNASAAPSSGSSDSTSGLSQILSQV